MQARAHRPRTQPRLPLVLLSDLLGSQPSSPRKPPPMSRRPISNTRRQSARAWVKARTVWQFEPTRKLDAGHVTRGETHGNVRVSKKGDIPKCQHG